MKRFVCLLLAAMMLFCCTSCSRGPASQSAGTSTPPAPAAPSSSAAPQPEPEPEPEPPYDPAVLTGLPKGEDYPEGQRVTAVMVNNISNASTNDARPQNGLSGADVLIEIKVEGGITRFCALFTDYNKIEYLCPVRSARDQFFQLFLPLQAIFIHIGESVVQKQYKADYSYETLDVNFDDIGFQYDSSRTAQGIRQWETAYLTGDQIRSGIERKNTDTHRTYTSAMFDFVNYNEPARVLTGDGALGIAIQHSQSYRTYFDWDAEKNKYMMSQYSLRYRDIRPTTDANNSEQLGFENVFVLFADFEVYPDPGGSGYDLQKVNYAPGGVGYYFSGGRAEPIRWKKDTPLDALYILDGQGNETSVKVNTGKSYIAVVDLDEAKNFIYNTEGTAQDLDPSSIEVDQNTENFVEAD